MIFKGFYNCETNGKLFRGPIFDPDLSVIVFDYEGVIDVQKGNYLNGRRNGSDKYYQHKQAKSVLGQALKDFDRIVLWSTCPRVLDLKGFPYDEVHQYIAGAQFVNANGDLGNNTKSEGELVKSLEVLTGSLDRVVGLEDQCSRKDRRCSFFRPLSRVVRIREHENLMNAYLRARIKMCRKK